MDRCSREQELAGDVLRYPPNPEKELFFAFRDGYLNIFFIHLPELPLFPVRFHSIQLSYCITTINTTAATTTTTTTTSATATKTTTTPITGDHS